VCGFRIGKTGLFLKFLKLLHGPGFAGPRVPDHSLQRTDRNGEVKLLEDPERPDPSASEPRLASVVRRTRYPRLRVDEPHSPPLVREPRGGQRGNLNAVRNPWKTYWKRRALKPDDRWVLTLVRDYVPALVADKGGDDAVSYAQLKVMELAAVARACWALALAAGNLEAVARFVGVERNCLADLGLERRAKPLPTLAEIMAESAERHE
jgi:hypothetical protein